MGRARFHTGSAVRGRFIFQGPDTRLFFFRGIYLYPPTMVRAHPKRSHHATGAQVEDSCKYIAHTQAAVRTPAAAIVTIIEAQKQMGLVDRWHFLLPRSATVPVRSERATEHAIKTFRPMRSTVRNTSRTACIVRSNGEVEGPPRRARSCAAGAQCLQRPWRGHAGCSRSPPTIVRCPKLLPFPRLHTSPNDLKQWVRLRPRIPAPPSV